MKAVAVVAFFGVACAFQDTQKTSAVEDGEKLLSTFFSAMDSVSASETEKTLNQKFEANLKTTEQLHQQFEQLENDVKNHKPPSTLQINLIQQDSSSTSQFADPNLADAMTKDLPVPAIPGVPGMEKAKNGTSQFVDPPKPVTDAAKDVADALTTDVFSGPKTASNASDSKISTFVDKGLADAMTKDIPIPGMPSSKASSGNATDATQNLLASQAAPTVSTFVDPPKPVTDAAKGIADALTKDIPIPGMPSGKAATTNATDSIQVLLQAEAASAPLSAQARPAAPAQAAMPTQASMAAAAIFKFPFFGGVNFMQKAGVKMEPAMFLPWMGAQGAAPHWYMGPWFGHTFF